MFLTRTNHEGYGSNILANYANSVVGIDISNDTIQHAIVKYKKTNLTFQQGSATLINLPAQSIDVVVSFETIEHLEEHDLMIQQIKKVLKKDGVLVISSPDKKNYSEKKAYNNPFHVKELYTNEFEALIKKYFNNIVMLYQKTDVASMITTDINTNKKLKEFEGDYTTVKEILFPKEDATYNICIASAESEKITALKFDSVFYNHNLSDYYFNFPLQLIEITQKNILLEKQINSNSYKIGRAFTLPIRLIKNMFYSKKY